MAAEVEVLEVVVLTALDEDVVIGDFDLFRDAVSNVVIQVAHLVATNGVLSEEDVSIEALHVNNDLIIVAVTIDHTITTIMDATII